MDEEKVLRLDQECSDKLFQKLAERFPSWEDLAFILKTINDVVRLQKPEDE